MADQNITELPVKTSSGMTASDYMLGIDSAEGYQMLIKDLGDYIIRNVQVNTIAGANQTLKSALDTLNSKKQPYFSEDTFTSGADLNQIFYGTYCCNTNALHNSILHKPDGMGTAIWRFTVVPLTNDGASNPTAPANWSRRAQIIYTGETEYWRVYRVDGNDNIDFGNWTKTPTRAEVDAATNKVGSFTTRSVSAQYTCAAKTQFNTNLKTLIDADVPSGYTVLGVVGCTTNDISVYVVSCNYSNNNYSLQIMNTADKSISNTVFVSYLCAML